MPDENVVIDEIIEKIAKECEEAKATKWDIIRIVKELEGEKDRDMESMRQKALEILERLNPDAAKIYASFYRMSVHNSQQEIRPFDRGNIVKSLLRETKISRSAAEKIGREVEDRLKDHKIAYLTTPLIREMANAKLLEYGLEEVRNEYARVGLPVFDLEKKILKNETGLEEAFEEFSLVRAIPKELSELHFNSEIFIDDLAGFAGRALACSISIGRQKTALHALREFSRKSRQFDGLFHHNACFDSFNHSFAGSPDCQQAFIAAETCQSLLQRNGSRGCVGLSLFAPPELKLKDAEKKAAAEFAEAFASESAKNPQECFSLKASVDDQFKHKLLSDSVKRKLTFINCTERNNLAFCNDFCSEKNAILCSVSINLHRICLESSRDEARFFEGLTESMAAAKQLCELKARLLAKKPDFEKFSFQPDGMEKIVALSPPTEAAGILAENVGAQERMALAEKIVKHAMAEFPEAQIRPLQSQEARKRFQKVCREKFGFEAEMEERQQLCQKSGFLAKNFVAVAQARSVNEFEELLKKGVPLIRLA